MSESQSKEVDYDSLGFIRIFTPMHVPKELIEQVRDRCFEVDDWYAYQEQMCTVTGPNGPMLNPYSLLYVVADEGNKVVGMLWCEINALSKVLIIQTFSMNIKYWGRGKAVKILSDKAKEICKECKLKKVTWSTNYPKHSERYGFERSRGVVMEWKNQQEKEDGKHDDGVVEADGHSELNDAGAARSSESVASGPWTRSKSDNNESPPGRTDGSAADARPLPAVLHRPSDAELRAADSPRHPAAVC